MARSEEPARGSVYQGRYELVSELGRGSSSQVWLGRQLSTGQRVAIKRLTLRASPHGAPSSSELDRFRRETRLCADLSHPNIVRLLDAGTSEDGGELFAVFEHVPGADLARVLARERRLRLPEAVHLMTQVLDALACAHRRGVIHRDLKPANVMISDTGARRNALVLDFGLGGLAEGARGWGLPDLTRSHEIIGTPSYAAPEQLRGERATELADLYSWGIVFLECLTGERASRGETLAAVIRELEDETPIVIPEWLRTHRLGRMLRTVTAKSVVKRTVTVESLMRTLALAAQADGAGARPEAGSDQPTELRQLALLSCNLRFVPAAGSELGVEELDARLRGERQILTEIAGRRAGSVVAALGNRVLIAFGHPRSREDDTRRAARAALDIAADVARRNARAGPERAGRVEVRQGLHTGVTVAHELAGGQRPSLDGLVGGAPEIALRMAERADAGAVLASEEAERLLAGEIAACAVDDPELGRVFRLEPRALATPEGSRRSPLVGRDSELAQLESARVQAQAGAPRVVLITGEAGIGKSRLLRELHDRAAGPLWLECRCIEENQANPLRPVVELLERLDEPLPALLERLGLDPAENVPLLLDLLGGPPDPRFPRPLISRELQKERTLAAVCSLLVRMAEAQPVVFVAEDLHWADPTTLDLLGRLVKHLRDAQVVDGESAPSLLALFTARPGFAPPWSAAEASSLALSRLSSRDVAQLVRSLLGARTSEQVVERILRSAEGIPLFIEELARAFLDAPSERSGDRLMGLPSSLRGLLMARIDRLSPDGRETAQLAAALGREFPLDELREVSPKDEATLREDLRELLQAELLFPRRSTPEERFLFKHVLLRDAAYESISKPSRQRHHARIAHSLRERFTRLGQSRPDVLAHHFGEAGETELAVDYWKQAGLAANLQGGYVEATRHLERGLELLARLPEDEARSRRELELLEFLGTTLLSTRGYAAVEVEQTFARARRIAERLGADIPFRTLYGIWAVQLTRGEVESTAELVAQFYRLAERQPHPVTRHTAIGIDGLRAFLVGDVARTRELMAPWKSWIAAPEHREFVREWGYDGGLHWAAYLMWSLWILGLPDQANAEREAMIAHAEYDRNPYNLAIAQGFDVNLAQCHRDVEATLERSARQIAHAGEQRLPFWLGPAHCSHGWAVAARGDVDAGIAEIRAGLGLFQAIGVRATYPYHLSMLVDACLGAGRTEEGLAAADLALEECRRGLDRLYEAELLRLRGELLRTVRDEAGAEDCLRRALARAREQTALAFELRAAASLARQLRDAGKASDAQALLAPVYGAFTEGFDTADLIAARSLCSELGG
jgi:TOMM system kinase/cyclase fusion protein